ncbi:unnamed protein product [Boreogadus saida]
MGGVRVSVEGEGQDEATICALVSVLTAEEQALGLPQPTGIGQRPWPMLSEGSQEAPSSTSSSTTALPNLGASQAPVCIQMLSCRIKKTTKNAR